MTAYDVFDWLEQGPVGEAIRDSIWLFPAVEAVHLMGLSLLGGAVLVVDLRLLGVGLVRRPVAYVVDQVRPWLLAALAIMFATGIPLFLSEAIKCYYSTAFRVKMVALALALAYTFAVRNRVARRLPEPGGAFARVLGASSILLWLTVAAAGRWIGFS